MTKKRPHIRTCSGIAVLLLLILCMGAGCTGNGNDIQENGQDALTYISEKYQRQFAPLSYDVSDYMSDRDIVECYTENMDPKNEHASVFVEKQDGKTIFRDNYFGFLIRDEVEDRITNIVQQEFSECKVYKGSDNYPLPDKLSSGDSLNDLYEIDEKYEVGASVFIDGNSKVGNASHKEAIETIIEQLAAENHNFGIQFYVVGNELYQSVDRFHCDKVMDCLVEPGEEEIYTCIASIENGNVKIYGEAGKGK